MNVRLSGVEILANPADNIVPCPFLGVGSESVYEFAK
jgi:hypothetical protein